MSSVGVLEGTEREVSSRCFCSGVLKERLMWPISRSNWRVRGMPAIEEMMCCVVGDFQAS